ncbi:MAG: SPFH domain-containing protein [Candidatus Absconditabacteria bacterium]
MEFVYIIGGLFVFFMLFGIKIVQPREVKLVMTLGKFSGILREGFNIIVPIIQTVKTQTLTMINLEIAVDGITIDNVKTRVGLNVVYKVMDDDTSIHHSIFKVYNVRQTIVSMIEEQLRAKIYAFKHDEIFGKRNEIGDEVKQILEKKLQEFGMELDSVQVKDISLDEEVMIAMNSVVASEKNKLATIRNAEAEKQSLILKAEADREVKKLIGEGMALQREAIANGFRNSIEGIKGADSSLSGDKVLEFLLASSRIETLEKIGEYNSKIIYVNENLEGKMASMINPDQLFHTITPNK